MTTRELLHEAIDNLPPQDVDAVYQFVRRYADSTSGARSGELMAMLQSVKIDGPADFSSNLDLYLRGAKVVSNDVR